MGNGTYKWEMGLLMAINGNLWVLIAINSPQSPLIAINSINAINSNCSH